MYECPRPDLSPNLCTSHQKHTKAKKQLFVRKEGQRPLAFRGLEKTSGAFKEPGGPFLSGAFEAAWGRYKKSGGNGGQGKLVAEVFGWETLFLAGKDSFGGLGGPPQAWQIFRSNLGA